MSFRSYITASYSKQIYSELQSVKVVVCYNEEPAYISRQMYGQQEHAKVISYKITYIIKKGQKFNGTVSKETFTTCKK